jgi:hypothetical protein
MEVARVSAGRAADIMDIEDVAAVHRVAGTRSY